MLFNYNRGRTVPGFNDLGLLPPGNHEVTIKQLRNSVLGKGPDRNEIAPTWDVSWRLTLLDNLEKLVGQLVQVGITAIYIDGSFVEEKDHPNDIDGYFECDRSFLISGEPERRLNRLDPMQSWSWDPARRRPYRGYVKKQLPMWHTYRVELYPHFGQGSGICDGFGNELEFPAAFRLSRSNHPKGIIRIGGLP